MNRTYQKRLLVAMLAAIGLGSVPSAMAVHHIHQTHQAHAAYSGYTQNWVGEPDVDPVGPTRTKVRGPITFSAPCSGLTPEISEEAKVTHQVTVTFESGVEISAGVEAGNALFGEIKAEAKAQVTLGAGWTGTWEETLGIVQGTALGACGRVKFTQYKDKYDASGTISTAACRFICGDPGEPTIEMFCGKNQISGDGTGWDGLENEWETLSDSTLGACGKTPKCCGTSGFDPCPEE